MAIWQRHPRYFIFVAVVLVLTFITLGPVPLPGRGEPLVVYGTVGDHNLPERIERSERIYQKTLKDREGLIKQFGPTPDDIEMCVVLFASETDTY